jgi:hypothetical protein
MDLVGWLFLIAFEGIVATVAVLLALTFIAFARMERDVRRARMFIMADRIKRFLGAFTVGFLVLAIVFASAFLPVTLPSSVSGGAFFFVLGTIAYGSAELFFIVRPKRAPGLRKALVKSMIGRGRTKAPPANEPVEEELHAAR